ncbi:MAG: beta-phosphoglucomutase [Cyclobacteriaceae bacterium]|nr:MAG: beta-phosphoglucomutase [Cyclobacteriaceae bacterium]
MVACIFDLDGVIVDTARYHFLAWQKLAKELNVELTSELNERLKGVGRMESLNIILELGRLQRSDLEKEALATRKNGWFVEFIEAMKKEEIFDGATELFAELKAHGVKVALASSSKNAQTVLKKLEIGNYFEAIVDGNMIARSKPDPEIFLKAAGMLQVNPNECVVVEDAEAGVEAAIRAGMKCVGIGKKEQLHKANLVVNRIGQLNYQLLNNL